MTNTVQLRNISKKFVSGTTTIDALTDVNLDIEENTLVALQGISGSGKSTLLNICGLLDHADSGFYYLDGMNVNELSSYECTELRRNAIGFVFQSFNLVPVMNVYENVEYPLLLTKESRTKRKEQVNSVIERVGLEQYLKHRPDQLSGGQRQRVAIARALVKQPQIVIADEPTANLDSETAQQIIKLLQSLTKERLATILIATHDDIITHYCDRIVRLKDGVIK